MSGRKGKSSGRTRGSILFLDPIGHLLATHDREICRGLSDAGYKVSLVTNSDHPLLNDSECYGISSLFGRCVGERSRFVKALSYGLFFPRFGARVLGSRPKAAILYYSLYPAADIRLIGWLSRRGIRTIVCAHDVLPLENPDASASLYENLYASAWRVLVFSEFARQELISRFNVSADKVTTLYFGEDWEGMDSEWVASRSAIRNEIAVQPEDKIVLCFGQIKQNKDLDQLFDGFAEVLAREPRAKLLVVGRPRRNDFDACARKVVALGIERHVVFRPEHIEVHEVQRYFQAADIVVLPYTCLYQSAVLPLACRFCKPVVANSVGSIPEVIRDGDSGYLVKPGDAKGLASAILQALSDPAEAQKRAERAYQVAVETYSWPKFCAGLEALLEAK